MTGTPMVVAYRVHALTAMIARRVIRVPWVSLVNLVADRGVVLRILAGHRNFEYATNSFDEAALLAEAGTLKAEAIAYLLSDKAKYVTGHNLVVDGGYGWLTSFGTASLVPVLSDGDPEVYELDLHFSGAIYPDRRPTPPVAASPGPCDARCS